MSHLIGQHDHKPRLVLHQGSALPRNYHELWQIRTEPVWDYYARTSEPTALKQWSVSRYFIVRDSCYPSGGSYTSEPWLAKSRSSSPWRMRRRWRAGCAPWGFEWSRAAPTR